jgi:aspartate/methionine/tyrosine aminotransferase
MSDRTMASPYMQYAKLNTTARYNLASSGVMNCTFADLDASPDDLELHGANSYGYAPLLDAIATRFGVSRDCVVTAEGTSGANHLAFSALISPGDEVLIEEPTYELMLSALEHLGARPIRFQRRFEHGWTLDPEAVERAMTPKTRLVVLSDLHNPTSVLASREAMTAVGKIAARQGAVVLVDEVYRELLFGAGLHGEVKPSTAFTLGPNFVVTSSLTKAYGLSGLRCGWILAPDDLAHRMWRVRDLFQSLPPFMSERLGADAFKRLPWYKRRADAILDANRAAYREFLGDHPALEQIITDVGTTVFAHLKGGGVDAFCERLMAEHDTGVVPGRFFERADYIRIGLGGEPEMTRTGIERLARALTEHALKKVGA